MSYRTEYEWKCQQCGLTFLRRSKGEPRTCPLCKDKGVKTFYRCVQVEIKKKKNEADIQMDKENKLHVESKAGFVKYLNDIGATYKMKLE